MLALFFLALPVEERTSGLLFLTIYLGSGLFGSYLHTLLAPETTLLVGAFPPVCGVAGALLAYYWRRQARLLISLFFIRSWSIDIPIFLYTLIFFGILLVAGPLVLFSDPGSFGSIGAFFFGLTVAIADTRLRPLPDYFTYPFEYKFLERSQENLSQYQRIQVFTEWLYYSPTNLRVFRALAKEVTRGSTNPKVNKVIDKFRVHAFPEVYQYNKRNEEFLRLLPIRWLSWALVGHSPTFLRRLAEQYEKDRQFDQAFKLYFLTLNEVGWRDSNDDAHALFKNYKKACIDPHFAEETEVLKDRHSPFGRFIDQRKGFSVA
jgi:hypothetical protein